MNNVIKAIKLKKELDSLRPLNKDDEARIMQKFRLDWNYHSNNLEGNTLSYGETKALILFGITANGKPLKDHFEITGHDEAIKWILDIVKEERPITQNFIRELHQLILKESYKIKTKTPDGLASTKDIKVGEYKTTPNHVETITGEIFRFASPEETPAKMQDLIKWYRIAKEKTDVNPILLATEFHYRYIMIHPFDDGNGRTARILMNFILMQFGYPPVIIKTEDKQNYFAALRQADAGLLEAFVEYISKNLNQSLDLMIKGAKGESIEELNDLEKEIALLEQKLKTVGQKIEVTKTKESLLELYNKSIVPLAEMFFEKGKFFEKFYHTSEATFYTQTPDSVTQIIPPFTRTSKTMKSNANEILMNYTYGNFNYRGFETFSFSSKIILKFQLSKYIMVNSKDKVIYEKPYNEQLTEKEIAHIVNTEIKRHKDFIEKKIEAAKKKK